MLHLVLIMSPKDQGLLLKVNSLRKLPTPSPWKGRPAYDRQFFTFL
jgi:hypothetical protein